MGFTFPFENYDAEKNRGDSRVDRKIKLIFFLLRLPGTTCSHFHIFSALQATEAKDLHRPYLFLRTKKGVNAKLQFQLEIAGKTL